MEEKNSSTLEDIEASASKTQTWAGAFLLFLPIVPIIATIICIATYLGLNLKAPVSLTGIGWVDTIIPLLVGIILTLIIGNYSGRLYPNARQKWKGRVSFFQNSYEGKRRDADSTKRDYTSVAPI